MSKLLSKKLLKSGLSVLITLFALITFSQNVLCYDFSGTTTGNILNGGYAASANDITVEADISNSALKVTIKSEEILADSSNAGYLNIVGDKICYISIDGANQQTHLKLYDCSTDTVTILASVPLIQGMKNLIVINGYAYFLSDGNIKGLCLEDGAITTFKDGTYSSFIPYSNGFIYTKSGHTGLYGDFGNGEITYNTGATYYDITDDGVLYYSNGSSGIYQNNIQGTSENKVTLSGGSNIICGNDEVCYRFNNNCYTLDGKLVSEQAADGYETEYQVVSGEIQSVNAGVWEEEASNIAGLGYSTISGDNASVLASDESYSAKLPDGDYKNWKQSDSRWGSNSMGNTTIARAGCAACSVAILLVGSGATKDRYLAGDFDPGVFVKEMTNNGGFTSGGGIYWYTVCDVYPSFSSLTDTTSFGSSSTDKSEYIANRIDDHNDLVVIRVHNPSTGNTHFVAVDYASYVSDYVKICDPGYSSKTGVLFTDYSTVNRAICYTYNGTKWDGGRGTGGSETPTVQTVATPVITATETSEDVYTITISCSTDGATIYYTTNGAVPTTSSATYTKAFTFTVNSATTSTIKAIAVKSDYNNSAVAAKNIEGWYNPFTDVKSTAWYYSYVVEAYHSGIVNGYNSTQFKPTGNITRAEFVTILSRLIAFGENGDGTVTDYFSNYESCFTDVPDESWYTDYVSWAYESGITNGMTATTFVPSGAVTREQLACFLMRFADASGATLTAVSSNYSNVTDASKVSSWAKESVKTLYNAGIINGYKDGSFKPANKATRAEATTIILRFMKKL